MTRIDPDWLAAPETARVLSALAEGAPLFVGGCVRDALIGRPTEDLDIAVTTPPERTMELAEAAGLNAYPTGVEHGVVTVTASGRPYEVATLRRDVATDGRRAVVAFAEDPAEDARRRDFTMNALYADGTGRVLDPTGEGLVDLQARRIRFIGDPRARIEEDYLRILRFFRFHAQFGIERFDEAGVEACRELSSGLGRISRERIGAEMTKLLAAPDPGPALAAMGPALEAAAPGADPAKIAPLVEAERRERSSPDPARRLAALGLSPGDAADALRLSGETRRRLSAIEAACASAAEPAEAAYRWGAEAAEDAVLFAAAAGRAPGTEWRDEIARGAAARPPVAAADLIALGAAPGPRLGAALKEIEARWLASGLRADRATLLDGWAPPRGPD